MNTDKGKSNTENAEGTNNTETSKGRLNAGSANFFHAAKIFLRSFSFDQR